MADATAGYDPADFPRIASVEDTHFWFVARNELIAAAIQTLPDVDPTCRVLEVGCGTGNTLRVLRRTFPDARLTGVDAFHAGLLYARGRAGAALVEARIEALPFAATFSIVGMFDVLEHLDDDRGALRAVAAALGRGGRLLLTVPANPALWSRFDEESHHRRRYTRPQLRAVIESAGFQLEYLTHFMSLTLPLVWASRRFETDATHDAAAGGSRAIDRELHIHPAANALLRTLLRVEVPAVRRRCSIPFGSSLLAIART